jgi:hypothetical protein
VRILNVHERELPVSTEEVGWLLNSLSSAEDVLWPRAMWPAMRFDRPLGVGASGGHGPVRYAVDEYSPGRAIRWRFSGPRGFNGFHRLEVLPAGNGRTLLRHTIDMKAEGLAALSWPLAFRPLHDALLDDCLALAQANLGVIPAVRAWSPWVRFLRWALSSGKAPSQQTPQPAVGGCRPIVNPHRR